MQSNSKKVKENNGQEKYATDYYFHLDNAITRFCELDFVVEDASHFLIRLENLLKNLFASKPEYPFHSFIAHIDKIIFKIREQIYSGKLYEKEKLDDRDYLEQQVLFILFRHFLSAYPSAAIQACLENVEFEFGQSNETITRFREKLFHILNREDYEKKIILNLRNILGPVFYRILIESDPLAPYYQSLLDNCKYFCIDLQLLDPLECLIYKYEELDEAHAVLLCFESYLKIAMAHFETLIEHDHDAIKKNLQNLCITLFQYAFDDEDNHLERLQQIMASLEKYPIQSFFDDLILSDYFSKMFKEISQIENQHKMINIFIDFCLQYSFGKSLLTLARFCDADPSKEMTEAACHICLYILETPAFSAQYTQAALILARMVQAKRVAIDPLRLSLVNIEDDKQNAEYVRKNQGEQLDFLARVALAFAQDSDDFSSEAAEHYWRAQILKAGEEVFVDYEKEEEIPPAAINKEELLLSLSLAKKKRDEDFLQWQAAELFDLQKLKRLRQNYYAFCFAAKIEIDRGQIAYTLEILLALREHYDRMQQAHLTMDEECISAINQLINFLKRALVDFEAGSGSKHVIEKQHKQQAIHYICMQEKRKPELSFVSAQQYLIAMREGDARAWLELLIFNQHLLKLHDKKNDVDQLLHAQLMQTDINFNDLILLYAHYQNSISKQRKENQKKLLYAVVLVLLDRNATNVFAAIGLQPKEIHHLSEELAPPVSQQGYARSAYTLYTLPAYLSIKQLQALYIFQELLSEILVKKHGEKSLTRELIRINRLCTETLKKEMQALDIHTPDFIVKLVQERNIERIDTIISQLIPQQDQAAFLKRYREYVFANSRQIIIWQCKLNSSLDPKVVKEKVAAHYMSHLKQYIEEAHFSVGILSYLLCKLLQRQVPAPTHIQKLQTICINSEQHDSHVAFYKEARKEGLRKATWASFFTRQAKTQAFYDLFSKDIKKGKIQ